MSQENTQLNKEEEKFDKPISSRVGAGVERGCTDWCCTLLLIGTLAGFVIFAGIAFSKGDLQRLVYGVDSMGGICSVTPGDNTNDVARKDWSSRQYLYYPVTFNSQTGKFNVADARNLGICVSKCPQAGDWVYTYAQNSSVSMPSKYLSLFDTSPKFHRCIPSILNFNCTNSTTGEDSIQACKNSKGDSSALFTKMADYGGAVQQGFNEVRARWWVLIVISLIVIVCSFLWLFVLKSCVKPMVIITILLLVAALAATCFICLSEYSRIKGLPAGDVDTANTYLAVGVITGIVLLIVLCIIIYMRRDIMIAADLIEEGVKVPLTIKTMAALPPVMVLLFLVPLFIFMLFVAANIYTASSTLTLNVPNMTNSGNISGKIQVVQRSYENWRPYGFAFTLFVFLWCFNFVLHCSYMILSLCSTFWYWANTGSPKEPKDGVMKAATIVLRYHLGTAAFGSLIIAIIQFVRIMMKIVEKRMEEASKKNDGIRCIMCCIQCCLAYLEKVVRFISTRAYIVQGMTGESFLTAARHALSLLSSNVASVAAVTVISGYVIFFSKVIITLIALGIAWLILSAQDDYSSAGFVFMMFFIGVSSYIYASIFMNIVEVAIDTVVVCYCYDLEINDGSAAKPHYFPEDLAQHFESAKARMTTAQQEKNKQFQSTEYQNAEAHQT